MKCYHNLLHRATVSCIKSCKNCLSFIFSQGDTAVPENKHQRRILYVIYAALTVLSAWLILRYAVPWLMPFILAFCIARLIEPAVHYMRARLHFKRGYAATLCTITVLGAIIALFVLVVWRGMYELSAFIKALPFLLTKFGASFSSIEDKIYGYVTSAPPGMQNYLIDAIDNIIKKSAELPAAISTYILGILSSGASYMPKIILSFFTFAISIFFISSNYKEIVSFLNRQIPENRRDMVQTLKSDLKSTLGKWLKAQLVLCGITMVELSLAFIVIGIDYAILLAALISVIDALPVFGAGTILIPWAGLSLIGGNYTNAIAIIATYGIVTIVRNLLEPKIVGKQIGLHPVATLIAMYIGFCSFGVTGMLLFPIILIMLKQINDRGYIKLWK